MSYYDCCCHAYDSGYYPASLIGSCKCMGSITRSLYSSIESRMPRFTFRNHKHLFDLSFQLSREYGLAKRYRSKPACSCIRAIYSKRPCAPPAKTNKSCPVPVIMRCFSRIRMSIIGSTRKSESRQVERDFDPCPSPLSNTIGLYVFPLPPPVLDTLPLTPI